MFVIFVFPKKLVEEKKTSRNVIENTSCWFNKRHSFGFQNGLIHSIQRKMIITFRCRFTISTHQSNATMPYSYTRDMMMTMMTKAGENKYFPSHSWLVINEDKSI